MLRHFFKSLDFPFVFVVQVADFGLLDFLALPVAAHALFISHSALLGFSVGACVSGWGVAVAFGHCAMCASVRVCECAMHGGSERG